MFVASIWKKGRKDEKSFRVSPGLLEPHSLRSRATRRNPAHASDVQELMHCLRHRRRRVLEARNLDVAHVTQFHQHMDTILAGRM